MTRRLTSSGFLLVISALLVLGFLVLPLLIIFPLALTSGELLVLPAPGYSLRWFHEFFSNARWMDAARNSFIVGLATMVLATLFGSLAAFGLHIGSFRGKSLLLAILTLPMVTPVVVTAIALYFAYAHAGLGSSLPALILAHTVIAVPYVVITVLAALQSLDPVLLRAAASLGASPLTGFRRVVLPLVAPGVATGALFAFAVSFDELVIALFLAPPGQLTLPRQMYAGLREFLSPTIAAAAVLLVLFSLVLLAISEWLRLRSQRQLARSSVSGMIQS